MQCQTIPLDLSVQNAYWESDGARKVQFEAIAEETWDQWFQTWLQQLESELPPAIGYELSIRLSDDREIQQLNAQYRHQDKPTDVLSFAALEVEYPQIESISGEIPLYLGDIIISVDTAARQAEQQEHSVTVELAWLAAHGLLHLLGWDHPDEESLTRMLGQQETLLAAVGLAL
ncbi:rRNA maturation RNase YbeY [Laspinema olomoucense]|uniref:rRNA maturation RNase YbeY n=1 Tax=Laspinema olomoucense TaxID=3231600 RepID=UPI0021BB5A0B|nr:rRNA maturation RNase YbeY [Laspinema sp. D3a]MCT7987977.1 rRNA maturation RNase YbeY [Laspinema sp. D3a]